MVDTELDYFLIRYILFVLSIWLVLAGVSLLTGYIWNRFFK